jgi:murein DD-endopeptidase MepM/ murein hydrolase activator NlpD
MFRKLLMIVVLCWLTACGQLASVTPFAATLPVANAMKPTNAAAVMTAVPTAHPVASRTSTLPPTLTFTPTQTSTPTLTPTKTLTPTDTLTPTITSTPVPIASATSTDPADDPNNTPVPTWTPPPPDPSVQIDDHYRFRRPISDSGVNYVARTYPYGGTAGHSLQVHHGVDMENTRGTPILAAADGVVFYAGDDLTTMFGPQNNYYGNLVVIQHAFTTADGQTVYSLYGHMDRVEVHTGQAVEQGDEIGVVGGSGVALGPHLHFEVRVGDAHSFAATRNPELWIYPYQTFATLAGRVVDANGAPLYDVTLQVKSTNITRYAVTYADNSVNADSVFNENFVLGDLPANYYEVTVSDNGRLRFQKIVYMYPNRTTWIDVQLKP